jgi:hypothetical protein
MRSFRRKDEDLSQGRARVWESRWERPMVTVEGMVLGRLGGIISEARKELSKGHLLSLLPDSMSVHPYLVVSLWPLVSFSGALLCGPLPVPAISYSRWRQTRMEFELGVQLLSFNPSLRKQRQVDLYEFGSSLIYIVRHCHHHHQQ